MNRPIAPGQPNTVAVAGRIEFREIIMAQGIQFTNADMASSEPYGVLPDALTAAVSSKGRWLQSMRRRAPLAITETATGFEFASADQNVTYRVRMVTQKDQFRAALLTANAHVIYDGHARYGRGPCFGILPTPGVVSSTEDWENGTDPATTGIFRMGFPFIGVPVSEIFEHGYTAQLVPSTVQVTRDQSDRDMRAYVPYLQARTADRIDPRLRAQLSDNDPAKTWWAYQAVSEGSLAWHVVLNAGWSGTVSAPYDLGATTPICRVFCHFGCESFWHNYPILRGEKFKNWQKQRDDRFAYFTNNLSITGTSTYWLYHLFTYPKANAFQDWGPSIAYAVAHTNADLRADSAGYQLI